MEFTLKRLEGSGEMSMCADLMVSSNPWNRLYFTKDQCQASLEDPEISVHGAVDSDGRVLGFLASMARGIGFEPMIEYLCVDESLRGRGIGTRLIAHFECDQFPDADNYYLFVSDINPHAARLYNRLGYLMVGALPNFNLVEQTEFLFRKTIRPRQAAMRDRALGQKA